MAAFLVEIFGKFLKKPVFLVQKCGKSPKTYLKNTFYFIFQIPVRHQLIVTIFTKAKALKKVLYTVILENLSHQSDPLAYEISVFLAH